MNQRIFNYLPKVEFEEANMIENITNELSDDQMRTFASIYNSKRKSSDTILLTCLLGLVVVAGVHRILLNQIGMGILYIFTAGLCFIGTIVDAVNYKKLALEFNQKMAHESLLMTRSMKP
jgi:TM2 domain-containing membrane protein YozV